MKKLLLSLVLAAAAAAPAAAETLSMSKGEAKLARELRGLTPGEPVDCIDLSRVRSSRIIDRTAIIYEAGRTLYVNRPRGGAESLNDWDVMVLKPFGSRLCSVDTIRLYDNNGRFPTGIVFLDNFVPYHRPKANGGR